MDVLLPDGLGLAGVGRPRADPRPRAQQCAAAADLWERLAGRPGILLDGATVDAGCRRAHVCHVGWPGDLLLFLLAIGNLPHPAARPWHLDAARRDRAGRLDGTGTDSRG